MGVTYARGSITGKSETREYDFLVDTGATWVGIPPADIDALGLDTVPNASAATMTADGAISHTPIYVGIGMLEGTGFVNGVVLPARLPARNYSSAKYGGNAMNVLNEPWETNEIKLNEINFWRERSTGNTATNRAGCIAKPKMGRLCDCVQRSSRPSCKWIARQVGR
jgi:hypothetical protein